MADKRGKDVITLGSGKFYLMLFSGTMPAVADVCKPENLLGKIKGGAALEYTIETYEEKDDLGTVSKVIVTSEEAILKCGIITWNGKTLQSLADRCTVTEADGKRTTKIGGAGNAQGGSYVACFHHEDKTDGDIWVMIKGTNVAGFSLTFGTEAGTLIEPEFKAMPHDDKGTLIEFVEEMTTTTTTES